MPHADLHQLELSLDAAPEQALPDRLHRLGLDSGIEVTLTRNRSVLVSLDPRRGLRLHAGYAWAPDDVLSAIIAWLKPRRSRADRLRYRRLFITFPVHRHVESRAPRRQRAAPPDHAPLVARLERLHEILNQRHFGGELSTVPVRLSERMRRRLGEFESERDGTPVAITISRRHLKRDGWAAATETLLHEMIHQWQAETGKRLGHDREFKARARAVGISPRATRGERTMDD